MSKKPDNEGHKPAEKPVSLHPLEFEEAVMSLAKSGVRREKPSSDDKP